MSANTWLFLGILSSQLGPAHDTSDVVVHGTHVLMVDDGEGKPSKIHWGDVVPTKGGVRFNITSSPETKIKDLEDATWVKDRFLAINSLDQNLRSAPNMVWVTPTDKGAPTLEYGDAFPWVNAGLEKALGVTEAKKILALDGKKGGLNVEGLSADAEGKTLLFGLRSPLVGEKKLALVIGVEDFGGKASIQTWELDLGGKGIRGMEYVPTLKRYMIVAGPDVKGMGYGLWTWDGSSAPQRQDVKEFDSLCRPESVTPVDVAGETWVVIGSESTGPECQGQKSDALWWRP